ncbi:MAG: DUF2442 domain-containing protein [Anaerolineales bacterium]|nr:DUF2442 domain-containing protein [Anaerolineales bacterium]
MLVRAQSVQPLTGLVVHVTFTDGTTRDVDLGPYLQGPVFEPLRKQADLFRAVRVEYGALTWPNGADIDPDVLYHGGTPAWARQHDQPEAA